MLKKTESGRRNYSRLVEKIEALITFRTKSREQNKSESVIVAGRVADISPTGVSFYTDQPLPNVPQIKMELKLPEIYGTSRVRANITWRDDRAAHYGGQFVFQNGHRPDEIERFLKSLLSNTIQDRRTKSSRSENGGQPPEQNSNGRSLKSDERRQTFRRISDLWEIERASSKGIDNSKRLKAFQRAKGLEYTHEAVTLQRNWLSQQTGVELKHISAFSEDPQNMNGNIENLVGVAQVPIGIAGPIKINGENAKGDFYVPMATTEGALVYTYTQGMQLCSLAGGITTAVIKDEIHISPIFGFDKLAEAQKFVHWLSSNFKRIKESAEKATMHGKLIRLEPNIFDKHVVVKFCYTTGDAMGFNMITFATEEACKLIVSTVKPEKFYVQSNYSSMKKVTADKFIAGYGKTVIAEVIIPAKLTSRIYNVSPQEITSFYDLVLLSTTHAGMVGITGHTANLLTAVFIACGQDVASVVDAYVGVANFKVTKEGDLYVSVKLPGLVVGTVGGGTGLGTQKECLSLLGCYGLGKSKKFAEIIAAATLAGEISITASIANGTFVKAHRAYGRKPIQN